MSSLAGFFAVLSVVCGLLFVYPYIIYPLVLRLLPERPIRQEADGSRLKPASVALLFCAYNEEAALPAKLENLRMMKTEVPQLKIYAYSDCSTDATNALLNGATDLLTPVIGEERAGKVLGMRRLVEIADADILTFSDANVMVRPGSLSRMISYFSNPQIGAVAATLMYEEKPENGIQVTAHVNGLYWRLEEHIKQLESKTGSMMGADGAFFARRRNGYPVIPPDLVDDMAVSLSVLFDGMRCISAPDVIGIEHAVENRAEEFRRKRRITCGSFSTYRFMRHDLRKLDGSNRFKFISHKLLRWWGAFFLLGALVFAVAAFFAAGVGWPATLAVAALAAGFVLLGRLNVPIVGPVYEIVLAVAATGMGVVESLTGGRYQTWEPAKTR